MEMTNFQMTVPKDMLRYLQIDSDQSELERNALLLYPFIKNSTISHGRAAEILSISKWELITLYNEHGLAYIDQDISEIEEEVYAYKYFYNLTKSRINKVIGDRDTTAR